MEKIKDDNPAFPVSIQSDSGWTHGMTLRDYFAGQAETAWIHVLAQRRHEPGYSDEAAAEYAAYLASMSADAMLAERAK